MIAAWVNLTDNEINARRIATREGHWVLSTTFEGPFHIEIVTGSDNNEILGTNNSSVGQVVPCCCHFRRR